MMNLSANLTETDKDLLNLLQNDFPLVEEPFKAIAQRLSISEADVINRIKRLKRDGIIRRIGPVFDANSLGYTSALFAVQVPQEKEDQAAAFISSFEGVTHNYKRDNEFNIWFTLVTKDDDEMEGIIEEIKTEINPQKLLILESERVFKIKGVFNV